MLEKVLLGRETASRYMQMFDIKVAPWCEPSWFRKTGDKSGKEIRPEVLCNVSEAASQFTSLADGEALVQAASIKAAAAISRQSVSSGHYMAALLRLMTAFAAAGSLGPGGLGVALAYATDLSMILADTYFGTMVKYDTRHRREASAQDWSKADLAATFCKHDLSALRPDWR